MEDHREKIKKIITSKPVTIFMKGTPAAPQCGFSAQTVRALQSIGVTEDKMTHFDVLSDPNIRQGIKDYTQWPTIPQVFINGEFIGGCDIVTEMALDGTLQQKLKEKEL